MTGTDPDKRLRLLVNLLLPACALVLAAFYFSMFRRDNAAPVVDLAGYRVGDAAGFRYGMERCWWNERKIGATGWIVRERRGMSQRSVRVVLVDRDGRAHALKTTLLDRADVSKRLNEQLGNAVRYRNAGFTASLNLTAAGMVGRPGSLSIAYDDGEARILLPIPCRPEQLR
ncbi:MAG TPA: hypothetical protein VM619_12410 [Luteimonas sp.]|nr:hypothetical protein [Luteimonas sp.]